MTRRVGISWLPIRWGLFFLFISGLQLLSAQEDGARFTLDSMLIKPKAAFSASIRQPASRKDCISFD